MDKDIRKGLQGVIADTSKISQVVPETSTLTYAGYSVGDLCEKVSFEEVCCLMLYGELPGAEALARFTQKERAARKIPDSVMTVISSFPKNCHPMDSLRTFVSLMALHDKTLQNDFTAGYQEDMAMCLLGAVPVFVAWDLCRREGRAMTPPDENLSFSENFLHMISGTASAAEIVKAFDVSLILYAEHSFNASTFTSRIITSTLSDYYGAIVGGIAALKGPLHGGANEAVMKMFLEIGDADKAEAWTREALRLKKRIMGFGHRVYRTGDSRVPTMKKYFLKVAKLKQEEELVRLYETVAKIVMDEKNIHPNLDYPSAPVYYLMGIPVDFFTPIFVMSRIAGWTAHIREQAADNRLIRPICAYVGEPTRSVSLLSERK